LDGRAEAVISQASCSRPGQKAEGKNCGIKWVCKQEVVLSQIFPADFLCFSLVKIEAHGHSAAREIGMYNCVVGELLPANPDDSDSKRKLVMGTGWANCNICQNI
jgi:hypothetical protein